MVIAFIKKWKSFYGDFRILKTLYYEVFKITSPISSEGVSTSRLTCVTLLIKPARRQTGRGLFYRIPMGNGWLSNFNVMPGLILKFWGNFR